MVFFAVDKRTFLAPVVHAPLKPGIPVYFFRRRRNPNPERSITPWNPPVAAMEQPPELPPELSPVTGMDMVVILSAWFSSVCLGRTSI